METSTSSRVEWMHGQTVKYTGSGVFKGAGHLIFFARF